MKRIINTIKRIYSNIKYILTNDLNFIKVNNVQLHVDNMTKLNELSKRIEDNYDKLDNKYYDLENSIEDVQYDMDNKLSYDDVVDEITDKLDSLNLIEDVKELKVLCDVLTRNNDLLMQNKENNDNSIDNLIERDLLINEVIKSIVNRLEINDNV